MNRTRDKQVVGLVNVILDFYSVEVVANICICHTVHCFANNYVRLLAGSFAFLTYTSHIIIRTTSTIRTKHVLVEQRQG
jgi:hypothetical protein